MGQDLTDEFRRAIEQDSRATDLDRIEASACGSDNFDGVQYSIYGRFIPVRPIIDVVAEKDGLAIEHMHHTNDVEEPNLGVFVAELPEKPHPAFVG